MKPTSFFDILYIRRAISQRKNRPVYHKPVYGYADAALPFFMPFATKRGTLFLMDINHAKGIRAEDAHKELETLDAILSEAEAISQECMHLFNLKRSGYTNREAVQKLGRSDTWAGCTLTKLHQRYME